MGKLVICYESYSSFYDTNDTTHQKFTDMYNNLDEFKSQNPDCTVIYCFDKDETKESIIDKFVEKLLEKKIQVSTKKNLTNNQNCPHTFISAVGTREIERVAERYKNGIL